MENSLANCLEYFAAHYPLIIPISILIAVAAIHSADYIRIGIYGMVDDWENTYPLKFKPFLEGLFLPNESRDYLALKAAVSEFYEKNSRLVHAENSERPYSLKVNGTYKYLRCHSEEHLKDLKHLVSLWEALHAQPWCHGHTLYVKSDFEAAFNVADGIGGLGGIAVLLLHVFALFVGLTSFKYLPTLTMGALVFYSVLLTTRKVVRLTKKFKKHIADPNAHKES